jgi:polyphosphate kinase
MTQRDRINLPNDTAESPGESVEPKLKRKEYEKVLRELQTELCSVQDWVKQSGQRIIVLFEGRDAAGKGGTIRAMTERVSPRTFRIAALPAPSDREKSQMYVQRYFAHFPAAGEIVIFDRSWYNRAGVEYVMGFCTKEQHKRFLTVCPQFERQIVDNGIRLIKYWLEVSNKEQKRRFEARLEDPLRQWKLSDMDLPSRERWYDYSRARDMMLEATDTDDAPWHMVRADDKRRARLNVISHFLSLLPYEAKPRKAIKLPNRDKKNAYDDAATIQNRRWIKEKY